MERFIPEFIVDNYNKNIYKGKAKAFTMFVDISGFTQTTESLSKFGKEGSEILSDMLHFLFEEPTKLIHSGNGFISNFIGDAFTAYFIINEKDNIDSVVKKVLKISYKIKEYFKDHGKYPTKFGTFNFGLKIGLGYGNINWEIIGTNNYKTYYFDGNSLHYAIKAESFANENQVLVHSSFNKLSNKLTVTEEINKNYYKISSIKKFRSDLRIKENKNYDRKTDNIFVGKEALGMKDGEFRNVISVYISFEKVPSNMNKFYSKLLNLSENTGGSKPQLFLADKGWNILLFFGAPRSYGNNRKRALEYIIALKKEFDNIDYFKAGITEGILYVGYTGSQLRREFTCFGINLNLSARMMTRSENGQIFVDEKLAKTRNFKFSAPKKYSYKGFSNKVNTFEFKGKSKSLKKKISVFGRDKEITKIKKFLNTLDHGSYAGTIYVSGKEGIGKTIMIDKVRNSTVPHLQWLYFPSSNIMPESMKPIISFLKVHFKIENELTIDLQRTAFSKKYQELIDSIHDVNISDELKTGKDFIMTLLDIQKLNRQISENEGKNILENTYFAVKSLLKALSLIKPIVIVFEDAQWMDEDTKAFLTYLTRNIEIFPIAVIFSLRPNDKGKVPEMIDDKYQNIIKLDNLKVKYSTDIIAHILGVKKNKIPDNLIHLITERSSGNPFYVEQFCYYLKENSLLDKNFELEDNKIELPTQISSIITARIDRFSKEIKELIETASVLGNKINLHILSEILNGKDVNEDIKKVEEEDIWHPVDQLVYLFKHILIRETAYNMLLKKKVRNLHLLAGLSIEKIYAQSIKQYSNVLAEHFLKAEEYDNAFKYLRISIIRSNKKYLFSEVEKHNKTVLKILPLTSLSKKQKYIYKKKTLLSLEHNYFLTDRYDDEYDIIHKLIDLAKKHGDKELLAKSFLNIYKIESTKGHAVKALKYTKKALKIAKENNYTKTLPFAYYSIAKVYMQMGKNRLCKKYTDIALKLYTENNDITGQSLCYNIFGLSAMDTNDWDNSLLYLNKQLKIGRKQRNKEAIAASMNNIALVFYLQKKYKKAKKWFTQVYKLASKVGFRLTYSTAVLNLGVLEYHLNNHEKALEFFHKKLDISLELGENRGILNARNNIAAVLFEQGKYHDAIPIFKENLELSTKLKLGNQIANNYHNLGQVYSITGNLDESIRNMLKAIEIHKKEKDEILQAKIFFDLANVYSNKNDEKEAEACYLQAMNFMNDKNDPDMYNKYKLHYCNALYVNLKHEKFVEVFKDIKDIDFDNKFKVFQLINEMRFKLLTDQEDIDSILNRADEIEKLLNTLQQKGVFYHQLTYLALKYNKPYEEFRSKSVLFFKKLIKTHSNYDALKKIDELEKMG
ncbi:MAG: tetratricopeptide repeat protein [Candidatus Delongbacteria bacterium]|nr:tetratricopeptide repeat protein [Candidatus Delongbacteria bacterium]